MTKTKDLKNWREKAGFTPSDKPMKIYYDPTTYAQTIRLVQAYPVEIGWNMVITPYKDGYKVWNTLIYPQKVSAGYISTDPTRWGMWKGTLDHKTEAALYGHGHSHVNMPVFSSSVDENQQYEEIMTKRGKGFYFFQIWNKRNDVMSFFYDLDNKVFYDNSHIQIIVEDADEFVQESFKMVALNKYSNIIKEGDENEPEQVV